VNQQDVAFRGRLAAHELEDAPYFVHDALNSARCGCGLATVNPVKRFVEDYLDHGLLPALIEEGSKDPIYGLLWAQK